MFNAEILRTSRYSLRPIVEDDIENIFKGLSNAEVVKYYAVSFNSLEATKEQMAWYRNLIETETGIWWTISLRKDNSFVGAIGFNDIERKSQSAEIGFWILPNYWRKGILSEVIPIVVDHAFTRLGLARIVGYVEKENQACRAALNKLGFIYGGTEEDCEIKDGMPISIATYSLNSNS
jgi:ribosomal-protein-alanine N-acetyltransferase